MMEDTNVKQLLTLGIAVDYIQLMTDDVNLNKLGMIIQLVQNPGF